MYDTILLPTDGSDGIGAATRHAGTIAGRFDATVHVLSVVDTRNRFESPSSGLSADTWLEAERERAGAAIKATVAELPDKVSVEATQREGVPKTEIVDAVTEVPADLVVMGTHGRTGLDPYLIGSVAETVVRESPVPTLTVQLSEE